MPEQITVDGWIRALAAPGWTHEQAGDLDTWTLPIDNAELFVFEHRDGEISARLCMPHGWMCVEIVETKAVRDALRARAG